MNHEEQKEFLEDAEQQVAEHVAKHDIGAAGAALGIRAAAQRIAEHEHSALKAEAEQKFKEAGLERSIAPDALKFHRGHTTSRFRIQGREATYGEFRSWLSRRGINADEFEKRLASTGRPERFITARSAVTVSDEPSQ